MSLEIYLVRHGETQWNVTGRFQGRLDSPLTALGIAQADRCGALIARALEGRGPVPLRMSPLGRTRETAALVRNRVPCDPVTIEPRLAEITTGSWDGLTFAEVETRWPERLIGADQETWFYRSPDGETHADGVARATGWLSEQSGTLIAVSHGLMTRLIRGAYLGLSDDAALTLPVPQGVVWRLAEGRVETLAASDAE